jgi:hypothetical protein
MMPDYGWYAVRCIVRWTNWEGSPYEERITLWKAASSELAIAKAEEEVIQYAKDNGFEAAPFSQAFSLTEGQALGDGVEVFSLLRDSDLQPDEYLNRYFSTGTEHQEYGDD